MKTTERHELKHNQVADTLQEAYARIDQNRKAILVGAVVVAVAVAGWGGYHYFAAQQQNKAGALLAQALVVVEAPVAPPVAPAAGQPAPPMPAGSYPTEQAKLEAALPMLLAAADAYPTTQAGVSARYQPMVSAKPDSKSVCRGVHPSSSRSGPGSIAYRRSWPARSVT